MESPTTMNNHNKKRNVGLIYEQLIRYTSKCLLEGTTDKAEIAIQIMKEHFKPGTELYKEFRLFNALVQTTVPSEALALRVLDEAKHAATSHDIKRLDLEKSILIKNINKKLDFPGFFDMRIPEYRKFATVQTLLNEWRTNIEINVMNSTRVEYESKVAGYLTENKKITFPSKKSEVTSLSLRLMQEKLERKYSSTLNAEQITLINLYVKASTRNDVVPLREACSLIKSRAKNAISLLRKEKGNEILLEKVNPVNNEIDLLPEEKIQESDLARYLTLIKLVNETENKENDK